MIDDIKVVLRISNTAFDSEIADLIDAAKQDLILSGVLDSKVEEGTDPLIKRAVSTYVKANFGWDNPDADKLMQSYSMLKTHLSLSQEYAFCTVTFTVTDGTNPIEDAAVTFNGEEKDTNSSGTAIFMGVKAAQNQVYTIVKDGYSDVTGTADIDDSVSLSVSMVVR